MLRQMILRFNTEDAWPVNGVTIIRLWPSLRHLFVPFYLLPCCSLCAFFELLLWSTYFFFYFVVLPLNSSQLTGISNFFLLTELPVVPYSSTNLRMPLVKVTVLTMFTQSLAFRVQYMSFYSALCVVLARGNYA